VQPGRNLDVYAADLERVEVLSGPQGTLFGASSQAGTVRMITNKPKIGVEEAKFTVGTSFTKGGDASYKAEADAGADTSGINAIDAIAIEEDNQNEATYFGFRVAALKEFNDDWSVLLGAAHQELETDGIFLANPDLDAHQIQTYEESELSDEFDNFNWTVKGREFKLRATVGGFYSDTVLEELVNFNYPGNKFIFGGLGYPDNFRFPGPGFSSDDTAFDEDTIFRNDVRRTDKQLGIFGRNALPANRQGQAQRIFNELRAPDKAEAESQGATASWIRKSLRLEFQQMMFASETAYRLRQSISSICVRVTSGIQRAA